MIIREIALNRFKKFQSLQLSLLPGLNIIKGPNEAGKSTLHSAVIAGLFFNPNHRRAEIKNNISWNSDKMYEIGLLVKQDGDEFALNKDFESKNVEMSGNGLTTEIANPKDINLKLFDWLGFSSASVFRSTACIEQDKIAQITKGDKEIGQILQSTITGEDDAVAGEVIEYLDKVLTGDSEGIKKEVNFSREIKKISQKIEKLENKYDRIKSEMLEASRSCARLLDIEEKLSEIKSKLQTKLNLKEKNERRREFLTEQGKLNDRIEHSNNCIKLANEINGLKERLNAYKPFFRLTEEDIDQFHSLLGKKQSLEEQQVVLEEQLKHPKRKIVQKRPKLNVTFISGIVLLWIGIIGAILTQYMLILAFGGLVALCVGIYLMINKSEVQIELSPDQIRNQINRADEQLNFVEESIKYFLSRAKCENAREFRTKLEGYKPLQKRLSEKEAELTGMIGQQSINEIRKDSQGFAKSKNDIKEELETLDSFALDPEAYQRLLDEMEGLHQEKAGLEKERRDLEIATAKETRSSEDLAVIEEKLVGLREKASRHKYRQQIQQKCLHFLDAARNKTLRSATSVLEQEIEKYIVTITDNRYGKVKVDAETLNIAVYTPDKKDYVPIGTLSRATIDQIYLAARLGLVKLVSGNKKPPLLFDDPFVTFDDKRLEATMELLIEIAKEYQILFFTCSNRYDQYADKVIDLRTYSIADDTGQSGINEIEIDPTTMDKNIIQPEPPHRI